MQKLQVKLKNALRDAPQVPNPVSTGLNREETPSVQSRVLACNSSDVDRRQHTGGQSLRITDIVYVLMDNLPCLNAGVFLQNKG